MTSTRLQKLRSQFDALRIDAFLVTFLPHLRYLSGFSGSNGLGIVTANAAFFLTDGRYADQVKDEVKGWKVFITPGSLFEEAHRRKLVQAGMRIGFDGNTLIFDQVLQLKKMFPKVKFLPKADTVEKIAAVKDEGEIDRITRAVGITDRVFFEILPFIKPGMSELDLAAEISYRQRKHGAEADAFETIVASGERGALPHGRATAKKIRHGELVTLDFGCVYEGYHSDLTRTVAVGKPKAEAKKIYAIVLDAQTKAIETSSSGMKAKVLDAVAREHIRKHGYDKFFRHSLGHGLGLQIHEPPRISVLSTATLETGNVITIEPGIYLPGFGGVRIEDDVVIRNGGCEILNRSPKELLVL
ncbi:MAG: aminopeptidase P family protein [Ignavibacteriae bacterium]|nr:aminopeptidase P family protein [Ignavibacteria bacterium]MBI3363428.1 aminopeptidase P family protein [Ignavibacteriota bacterium]